MASYYRTSVETYSIIGTDDEKGNLNGNIPDGSSFFAVDTNSYYTRYNGTWYKTMPEAARLLHDNVGTDTKPIKLVGGVATAVSYTLAKDSEVVHKAGAETITGNKTFNGTTTVKAPTSDSHASTKKYVDDAIGTAVLLTGNQTIGGEKKFTSPIEMSADSDAEETFVRTVTDFDVDAPAPTGFPLAEVKDMNGETIGAIYVQITPSGNNCLKYTGVAYTAGGDKTSLTADIAVLDADI